MANPRDIWKWAEAILLLGLLAFVMPRFIEHAAPMIAHWTGEDSETPETHIVPLRTGPLDLGQDVLSGQVLRLGEEPAAYYAEPNWTEADQYFGNLVENIPNAEYDPLLSHAARELAALYARTSALADNGPFMFLLNSAGAADWAVRQSLTLTTAAGDAPILSRLRAHLEVDAREERPARVGIGEVLQLGVPPRRSIAVLISKSDLYLDPVPRRLIPGTRATIRGTLPRGATQFRAVGMGPDEKIFTLETTSEGERFEAIVPAGIHRGVVWVELIASLSHGPTPLAQLGFYVGTPIPREWMGPAPDDETDVLTERHGEQKALRLLNRDRLTRDLPALVRTDALSDVARKHCNEMAETGYFGHSSPLTGTVRDRMNDAGLEYRIVGENLARNSNLSAAQGGLMFSLGHRKNILSKQYKEVGIGVHRSAAKGSVTWHVCQVFAGH